MASRSRKLAILLGVATLAPAPVAAARHAPRSPIPRTGRLQLPASGLDGAALAARLGVSLSTLQQALDAVEPPSSPFKDRQASGPVAALAAELGTDPLVTRAALTAAFARTDRDGSDLSGALAERIGRPASEIEAALERARQSQNDARAARRSALAAALAARLGIPASDVLAAVADLRA